MIETGIKFDNLHSFRDLNLVLSAVSISPALPKEVRVDIPGGDGSIDLTEAHGDVKFYDRDCKFTFTMNPSGLLSNAAFEAKKSEVSNYLNGKRCKITLDKDSGYYYEGRCTVNEYLQDRNLKQIVVTATVAPYKLKQSQTSVTVPAGTNVTATLKNGRKKVVPTIVTTAAAKVVFGDGTYNLSAAGNHRNLGIVFGLGPNTVTVTSTAAVKFLYQEGDL